MLKVIKFALYLFKSLFSLIAMIPQVINSMMSAIQLMPTTIAGLCVGALSILIIYTVIGRGR